MKHFDVAEVFEILKEHKITTNIESVRRWLRQGVIKGIAPVSRSEGWLIPEENLNDFLHERLPKDHVFLSPNTTNVVNKIPSREEFRAEMWWELVRKNIFESVIEIKKKDVQYCIEHLRMSDEFGEYVWKVVSDHKRGYATPRVPYILEAFLFDGNRILMDQNYEDKKEQILFALVEFIRLKRVKGK